MNTLIVLTFGIAIGYFGKPWIDRGIAALKEKMRS